MAKSERLFALLDLMRRLPAPVTAARLADELGISERTLYRDIDALRAVGARIEGAAGYGYSMAEDPALPPQRLTRLEIEALVIGFSAVSGYADPELVAAGESALSKIVARLPDAGQREALHAVLMASPMTRQAEPGVDLATLRRACWDEREVEITYTDSAGRESLRRIWPLCIVYMDNALLVIAHCLLRNDARSFRLDRMQSLTVTAASFRPRRVALLTKYSAENAKRRAEFDKAQRHPE